MPGPHDRPFLLLPVFLVGADRILASGCLGQGGGPADCPMEIDSVMAAANPAASSSVP